MRQQELRTTYDCDCQVRKGGVDQNEGGRAYVAALLDSPEVSPWLLEPDATELLLNTVFIRFIYLEMPSLSSL